MQILIVDDDPIASEILKRMLLDEGHQVVCAADGREALELVCAWGIRMVISDWNMPGMDGLTLCREIRKLHSGGYIYTILLTSRHRTEDTVACISAGADDFIVKPFDPAELRVRLMAGQRILSLETRHVAIFALAKLAESRDPETGLHLERIREYSRVLAGKVAQQEAWAGKLSADFVETIYLTSPLHDIGKVGVPDCVLLKPGQLSEDEFAIMKAHTEIGGETLCAAVEQYPSVSYLRIARDIALGHHERFDGTGYPRGLAGQDIPLAARIVALADVYDALTSKRVYKDAFSHAISRSMILEGEGTHFDPQVVEAFLCLLKSEDPQAKPPTHKDANTLKMFIYWDPKFYG